MSGLYVHVPFCQRVCVYCDFAVTTARKWFQRYTSAVVREIDLSVPAPSPSRTVYLGGGTPSYLPLDCLKRIVTAAVGDSKITGELTLEANPNQVRAEQAEDWRRMGINRLSMGVQSFNEKELKFLTRNHTAEQAIRCVEDARTAGFDNLSIDLIFGLPGQTSEDWQKNIERAIEMAPDHLSVYNLTYEPGTPLHKWSLEGKLSERDDDTEKTMFLLAHNMLEDRGFEHYEISNYAKPGFKSRHNSAYWNGDSYIGVGPSAHSFDGAKRWWNVKSIEMYMNLIEKQERATNELEMLTKEQQVIEFLMLGLRQAGGVSKTRFLSRFGEDFETRYEKILSLYETFFVVRPDSVGLTPEGWFLYDHLCRELISS